MASVETVVNIHLQYLVSIFLTVFQTSNFSSDQFQVPRPDPSQISDSSSVPEGKLMGVELIGVYKSGSINWG